MLTMAWILSVAIGLLIVGQIFGVAAYIFVSKNFSYVEISDARLPPVAVILSLRGSDPYLNECLERLSTQDYPNYKLHIVIDHDSDPARNCVRLWSSAHPDFPLQTEILQDISAEAYLKTNAIRQCIMGLDSDVGFVVLVDADTLVYDRWLRDTVSPMIESDIGVVTGNRWYDPTRTASGSLVRCIYNSCSISPMYFMRATWGGALGMRRDVFAQDYFMQRMKKTPSEDQAIQKAAQHVDAKVEVHPRIMIFNREECSLMSCFNFIRRQLIWTRLYHPNWSLIVGGVLSVYLLFTVTFFAILVGYFILEPQAASIMLSALLLQIVAAQFNLEWLHNTISRRMLAAGDQAFPRIDWISRIRLLAIWPLGFLTLCWAVVSATFCRSVQWRGITYAIVPPDGIQMLEYRPYVSQPSADGVSLG